MLSCSIIAGICMWLLDRRHRKSNFPHDFRNGAGIGIWWAIVTLTTVGYGDRVPKTKQARGFATLWIIAGVMILAGLQGTVIEQLSTSASDLTITQLAQTSDNLAGVAVGVFGGSTDEWRVRSRGARVTAYGSVASALDGLERGEVTAVAVDTLASAVVVSDLSHNDPDRTNIRPDGQIVETTTFGVLFSKKMASLAASSTVIDSTDMQLSECVTALSQTGPAEYNMVSKAEPAGSTPSSTPAIACGAQRPPRARGNRKERRVPGGREL